MHSLTSAFLIAAVFSASQLAAQDSSTASSSSGGSTSASGTSSSASGGSGGLSSLVSGLSTTCQAAAGSLLSSEFGSCANIIGLVSVIGAQGSVVPALNTWIGGVCSSSPCSNSTISTAQSSVNSGCSDDVTKGNAAAVSLSTIISNYAPIRNLLCTQYTSNGSYCVPTVLTNVQTATGKNVSVSEVQPLLTQGSNSLSTMLSAVPTSAYCIDCGKAIFVESAMIKPAGTSSNATVASGSLSDKCGASFADGQLPSSVRIANGPSSAAGSAKSSAVGLDVPRQMLVLGFIGLVGSLLL